MSIRYWRNGNKVREWELEDEFYEWMNEVFSENVNICGLEMNPVDVLKHYDPIAYREYFLDWINSEGIEEVEE